MDDRIKELTGMYEDAAEATQEERARSERDRDYYDHKQFTDDQLAELRRRKQAPVIINFIQKKINYLLGAERSKRQDPKAFPRTPLHEDAAHAASDSIRFVCEKENFDALSSDAYEDMLVEGIGSAVVEVEPTTLDDYEIKIRRIPWDRHFRDPHCREKDFSDAAYEGYIRWVDLEEAQRLAKKHGSEDEISYDESSALADSHEDRPAYKLWSDKSRKRVKLCYLFYLKEGTWHHAIFTKSGYIWKEQSSPYLDEDGQPCNPMITQSPMVDRENNRYGYARLMISQQDAINKRESKTLHLLSQRQTWARKGTFGDNPNQAKTELAKPDGHLEITDHSKFGEDFGIFDTGDMAQGQFLLLQEAKRDLDVVAATGNVSTAGSQSGRALEARAQSGQIELTPFTDSHKQWKKRIYRAIWNRIRQFWNEEKWVRVTDDENNLKWVGLNTPVTAAEQLLMQQTGMDQAEIRKQYAGEIQQAIAMHPQLGQQVETQNQVAELDVDIIIDEAPDIINLQAEQFQTIASIAERRNDIPTPLIIKMSQLRNKDQILDELQGNEQMKAAAADKQNKLDEIQMRKLVAETLELEGKAANQHAQAEQKQLENMLAQTMPDPTTIITI